MQKSSKHEAQCIKWHKKTVPSRTQSLSYDRGEKEKQKGGGNRGGAGGGRGRKLERKRKPGRGIRKSTLTSAVWLVHLAALSWALCRSRPCTHRQLQVREKGSVTISPHGPPPPPGLSPLLHQIAPCWNAVFALPHARPAVSLPDPRVEFLPNLNSHEYVGKCSGSRASHQCWRSALQARRSWDAMGWDRTERGWTDGCGQPKATGDCSGVLNRSISAATGEMPGLQLWGWREEGRKEARKEGKKEGRKGGEKEGRKRGREEEGKDEGWEEGRKRGRKGEKKEKRKGRKEEEGRKTGRREEGREEKRKKGKKEKGKGGRRKIGRRKRGRVGGKKEGKEERRKERGKGRKRAGKGEKKEERKGRKEEEEGRKGERKEGRKTGVREKRRKGGKEERRKKGREEEGRKRGGRVGGRKEGQQEALQFAFTTALLSPLPREAAGCYFAILSRAGWNS